MVQMMGTIYWADTKAEAIQMSMNAFTYESQKNYYLVKEDGLFYEIANGNAKESADLSGWFVLKKEHDALVASITVPKETAVVVDGSLEERLNRLEVRFDKVVNTFKGF